MPREIREALERRLESADEDFRYASASIRTASSILLLLALVAFLAGLGRYFLETSSGFESSAERASSLAQLFGQNAVGLVFLACFACVKRAPVLATAAGIGVWVGLQVATAIASPISMLPIGLVGMVSDFLRLAFFLLLVRGLVAAVRGGAIIRKMTR